MKIKNEIKNKVIILLLNGLSYSEIAKELKISILKVKQIEKEEIDKNL